ncbi:MAG: hypothetical protein ACYC0L_03025 [Thermoleophilia bacterium]
MSMWLYFGDNYVPLRQVRRALGTWQERAVNTPIKIVRQTVQQVFGVPTSRLQRKDRKVLLGQVTDILFRFRREFTEQDKITLHELLKQILGPSESGLVQTIGGEALTPDACVELLTVTVRAFAALSNNEIDDSLFHWARYAILTSYSDFKRYLSHMTTVGAPRGLTIPTFDKLAQQACFDLVTQVGLGLGMPGGATSQSIDHPAFWKNNNLRSIVHGELVGNSVRVVVEVQPVE